MLLVCGQKLHCRRRPRLIGYIEIVLSGARKERTSSTSKVVRMTETAAAFREARTTTSCSGEYLQFLYCVLASYNGLLVSDVDCGDSEAKVFATAISSDHVMVSASGFYPASENLKMSTDR